MSCKQEKLTRKNPESAETKRKQVPIILLSLIVERKLDSAGFSSRIEKLRN